MRGRGRPLPRRPGRSGLAEELRRVRAHIRAQRRAVDGVRHAHELEVLVAHRHPLPLQPTAQEALDGLVKDWKAIFKEEGKKF